MPFNDCDGFGDDQLILPILSEFRETEPKEAIPSTKNWPLDRLTNF
jgi:hypothetical protein